MQTQREIIEEKLALGKEVFMEEFEELIREEISDPIKRAGLIDFMKSVYVAGQLRQLHDDIKELEESKKALEKLSAAFEALKKK